MPLVPNKKKKKKKTPKISVPELLVLGMTPGVSPLETPSHASGQWHIVVAGLLCVMFHVLPFK